MSRIPRIIRSVFLDLNDFYWRDHRSVELSINPDIRVIRVIRGSPEPNSSCMIRELIEFRQMPKEATEIPGQIGASDLYTIGEVQRRLGLSSWATWKARRSGLKVYKISRQRYVLGKDYIAFVESTGKLAGSPDP